MHVANPGRPYLMIFNQWFLIVSPGNHGFIQVVSSDRDTRRPDHGRICSLMHSSGAWAALCITGFFFWNVPIRRNYTRISEIGCSLAVFESGDSD